MGLDKIKLLYECNIAVIGGGVVGCAVARRLTLEGASVILIEKESDILEGASKGNSAILHTGFDAPENSVELECIKNGYNEYLQIHKKMNLPLKKTGALVTAWTEKDVSNLENIVSNASNNGIEDLAILTKSQALVKEPNLAKSILSAIEIPKEYIIDPWSAPLAYLSQAVLNGCKVCFNTEITQGDYNGKYWLLKASKGYIKAKYVVNCAGLNGDDLDKNLLKKSNFEIRPRKGEFIVFDKSASKLIKRVILQVPSITTKGIVVFPTIFGNLAVGPTAVEQKDKDDTSVSRVNLQLLYETGIKIIPELKNIPVIANYAGIRPASNKKEYIINFNKEKNWLTIGGIRSTGLTSALGVAQYVSKIFLNNDISFKKITNPKTFKAVNIAEYSKRDFNQKGYSEIVCHCELVTKREIDKALTGILPARSLGGLKRKTRVTMGACQGFYCSAKLAEITEFKFKNSMSMSSRTNKTNE